MSPYLICDSLLSVCLAGYTHNPYNGVVCNDTILATGVFSSKELWRLSKGGTGTEVSLSIWSVYIVPVWTVSVAPVWSVYVVPGRDRKLTRIYVEGEWKKHLGKITPNSPDRDSNIDLPIPGSLAQRETCALANYVIEAPFYFESVEMKCCAGVVVLLGGRRKSSGTGYGKGEGGKESIVEKRMAGGWERGKITSTLWSPNGNPIGDYGPCGPLDFDEACLGWFGGKSGGGGC
ncbi:unnamed protein product [Timema podura]|uniref:Uncharacterized protein n=1 Tax=Timema podura TaxID=61482 RepID=A0ABN7NBH8_TIMPD|nr:unnamed protein product [Timema podura]